MDLETYPGRLQDLAELLIVKTLLGLLIYDFTLRFPYFLNLFGNICKVGASFIYKIEVILISVYWT